MDIDRFREFISPTGEDRPGSRVLESSSSSSSVYFSDKWQFCKLKWISGYWIAEQDIVRLYFFHVLRSAYGGSLEVQDECLTE